MDQLYVVGENTHYLLAAQTMIELDEQKNEVAKAKVVSNKVTSLGFGDAIRKKVAQYAGVKCGQDVPIRNFSIKFHWA